MKYHGKGDEARMTKSAQEHLLKLNKNNPTVAVKIKSTDWTSAATNKDSFIQEAIRIRNDNGVKNANNLNKINSFFCYTFQQFQLIIHVSDQYLLQLDQHQLQYI